jgi:hypothetical protein
MQTAPTTVIVISFAAIERFENRLNFDIAIHPLSAAHTSGACRLQFRHQARTQWLKLIHFLVLTLGLAAAILPAMPAAFVGGRSYTELPPLADQSSRIHCEMEVARIRIQKIDLAESLASQVMGLEIYNVAAVMFRDIQVGGRTFSST